MPTIAQLKQQVKRIWVASFQTDLSDTLAAHLCHYALAGVQAALEAALVEELELHHLHARQAHPCVLFPRSGTYTRRVLTSHGFIPDLHVPKLHSGNGERPWQVVRRYQLMIRAFGMPSSVDAVVSWRHDTTDTHHHQRAGQ